MAHRSRPPPPPPTRAEVEDRLLGLLNGSLTRDKASSWAAQWVAAWEDPGVEDSVVWQALGSLVVADAPNLDGTELYGEDDFAAWLDELRRG